MKPHKLISSTVMGLLQDVYTNGKLKNYNKKKLIKLAKTEIKEWTRFLNDLENGEI